MPSASELCGVPGRVSGTQGREAAECGRCCAPVLEECLQHHGHKGDPGVTPGTCGAIGERAQVILVWVRAPGRWEHLHPRRLGVMRVRPRALHGSWCCDSKMPKNTSIRGVGKKLWSFEWDTA